jgi:hypothetical protein
MIQEQHIHYYDWIISWEFNSDGKLILTIGKSNESDFLNYFLPDVPDVKTGIDESKAAIDLIRSDRKYHVPLRVEELNQRLYKLKHPQSRQDEDTIPF